MPAWLTHRRLAVILLIVIAMVLVGWGIDVGYRGWRAHRLWQEAQQALDDLEYEKATVSLKSCLDVWPGSAETHLLLAQAYRRLEKYTDAQTHLEAAERLKPSLPELQRESLLLNLQRSGPSPEDVELLSKHLQTMPAEGGLIIEALVKGFYRRQQLNDVMHWLDYWVDHYPDDWHGHFYRADICHGAGVVDRARADFERVLELNPDQSEARRLLASILTNSGQDLDQAIRHWEIYEKSHPDNPEVLAGLARCHHGLGDLKAAKASLEQLLAKNPNHAGGLLWLAQVEADLDRPEEALASLKRLDGLTLDNLPDIQRSVALRANVHRRLGHTREAEFYEKRMEEIKADVVELGRTSEPLVKGGASSPALRLRMGQLYFRLGLEEEAKRWFETVLQEAPDHVEAHRALAEFYQKRTDPVSRSRAEYHRRAAAGSSP